MLHVTRSLNHCCSDNVTVRYVFIIEVPVTVNDITSLSVAQKLF
jgi:hypothetical protein